MDPNAPGYPAMQPNTGYPVPSQNNPQQFPYYPNQMPSFPQSNAPSQHSFGAVPLQAGGPGGAMMPSGFPQQSTGPHANFATPFAQPPSVFPQPTTSTSNIPTTTVQAVPQNMASVSAKNMVPAQHKPPIQQPASHTPVQAVQSPAAAAREKDRVSVLLDINSLLLQEVINLQSAGKAGGPPVPQASQESHPSPASDLVSDKTTQRSPEYVACMRRLQANLAYLAHVADRPKKAGGVVPTAPAYMTPPPNMPAINELYTKLNELFPRAAQGAANTSQPSPQGSQGNGGPSPSPAGESVV
ncbi:hypothetical protein P175DRAFT_0444324 [Aspergillus ochraceoroseus IBT 24754]|uniref:Glutamine repeat protein-1 n=3 Tax=Aspergillus subgen. Nidulantes TaxID=2720870 RepID=A0A0F8WP89_9EURO|nr:uncharacterized protein P175DRAFT_0444324 [Aspergillus ochraceoroseus IBT 24754]KKK19510.1 hypothetical protein ARAM_003487 [Aspergillus rambellii]KKK24790.1 hypothetical protein AOCH_006068 [Aspergillus ochraceoroseus]PTU18057.1 hypothetical protein P175DRAFT_0444324 [Aspergillus ochraceoroseus IBT 24754]